MHPAERVSEIQSIKDTTVHMDADTACCMCGSVLGIAKRLCYDMPRMIGGQDLNASAYLPARVPYTRERLVIILENA